MSHSLPPHSARVIALLAALQDDRNAMLKLGIAMTGGKDTSAFPLDLMAFGAVKRNLSLTSAMSSMVESWNMVCSRALLRLHIDTALRFSAAWMVDQPHDLASQVLKGERIDKMKDREGNRLQDAYLVKVRSADYPWLPTVYETLSGYVHFSGSHIFDSIASVNDEDRSVSFEITETDLNFPESSWVEILECFRDATEMLAKYLHGYGLTKQLSQAELEAGRSASGH